MKIALIIGCEGQDGRLIRELLLSQGYAVLGLARGIVHSVNVAWDRPVDIFKQEIVLDLMKTVSFDEIYYLAAHHQSSQDPSQDNTFLFKQSHAVNVEGLLNFLEAIRLRAPKAHLFYAASSLLFANTTTNIQDEQTPFAPDSIYGMTKLNGLLLCRYYRQQYGVFASTGILYNHESPYRAANFISTKIVQAAVKIKQGKQEGLVVGDLNASIDWGYAPDYVKAMQQILSAPEGDEFIIATGQKHCVRDFVQIAFDCVGLDWKKYVKEDIGIMTRKRKSLVGNSQKLMDATGWRPSVDFKGMIKLLVEAQGVCV